MIGGKMVGSVLALMIADIKRVSQVFRGFRSTDMLGDCRKSLKMVILAISHVMKSMTYKHQIHRFRVFRQSLEKSAILLFENIWVYLKIYSII
jgi:hypothetical protein